MRAKILGLFLFCLAFLFLPRTTLAADEFSTAYDVTYEVGSDTLTNVTQKVTLKNLTSQYYASNFTLTIGSTTITDVTASDDSGQMETKVEHKDNKTSIVVKFNQQVAGVGKEQGFTLKFKSKDFADMVGKTWEVNLPKIPEGANIEKYNLVLSVPLSFGDPTSISPLPKSESQNFDRQIFVYEKGQLQKSGVSVNFGNNQIFDFNLKYHLQNDSLFPVLTSITLPPDTTFQDVGINRLDPAPLNVTVDEDGNYLAWYRLTRKSNRDVSVSGSVKLYIRSKDKKTVTLTSQQQSAYTKSDQYWEKDNPAVTATLLEIFKDGTPKTTKEKANKIYQYVVDTLTYDASHLNDNGVERLGAVTVLNNPKSAVCMEFTDLFIALSRAAGIPARELDGFAYTQNKNLRPLSLSGNLLHAWPEYFDENSGWVMVDPTWENTSGGVDYFNKFDLNHVVFEIRGVSSKEPSTTDDVKVSVSGNDFVAKPQIEVTVDAPQNIWSGFPATATVKVVNQGNSVQPPTSLSVSTDKITILDSKEVNTGPIPPFGFATYTFNLRTPNVWQNFSDTLSVNVGEEHFTKDIVVKPLIFFKPVPYVFAAVIGLVFIIYAAILAIHIARRKQVKAK
jgi:transglutaminase-like putative cysteine protease